MQHFIDKLGFSLVVVELPRSAAAPLSSAAIKHLNASAGTLLGYAPEEITGKPFSLLVAPEICGRMPQWLSEQAQFKQSVECLLRDQRGRNISALLSFSPLPETGSATAELVVLIQDFNADKQRLETLEIMHRAVEQSASAVVITDRDGNIEYTNPKFTHLTGFSAAELLGQNLRILQSGMTSKEQYREMWQALLEIGEWRGEIQNRKKNGERFWAYEAISAIKNQCGEIVHFLSIAEDISQRKNAEAALMESEERFRQMAEMAGEWLWEQNAEGYYIYSSNAVKKILGLSPDWVVGKHYTEFLTVQDKESLKPNADIQLPFYALTNHYRHRDGHLVITESTGLPIKNSAGELLKWRGVDRDITARKHFEDALIDSEKRKRLIFETALSAIVIMDSDGTITGWNRHAEKMFGWPREEAIGQPLAELIIPLRFRAAHRQGLQRFLDTGQGKMLNRLTELSAVRRDGSEFPVEFSISPLQLGASYEFSGFIHDITARKLSEQRIRQGQVDLAIARNEIKIAQQIQASLFPAAPLNAEQFEICGYCLPADQVGGDYYDYFQRGAFTDMVIADVSGHSVGPALFMAEARSALRAQANWPGTPAQILTILNNLLFDDLDRADYFITLSYLQYHSVSRQLRIASAGHPPPLLIRGGSRECVQLDADGLILGIRRQVEFEEKVLTLEPGDMILLYTDGLTEAENGDNEFFGAARATALFASLTHLPPQQIIATILERLKQFHQQDSFGDDITLLVFKCLG